MLESAKQPPRSLLTLNLRWKVKSTQLGRKIILRQELLHMVYLNFFCNPVPLLFHLRHWLINIFCHPRTQNLGVSWGGNETWYAHPKWNAVKTPVKIINWVQCISIPLYPCFFFFFFYLENFQAFRKVARLVQQAPIHPSPGKNTRKYIHRQVQFPGCSPWWLITWQLLLMLARISFSQAEWGSE